MTHVTTERIDGETYDITVDTNGMFQTQLEGSQDWISAKTLDDLKELLRAAVKRARAFKPLEVTLYDIKRIDPKNGRQFYSSFPYEKGRGLVDAILRGYSERRRALLLTIDDKKFQCDDYTLKEQVLRRLTPDEDRLYEQLVADLVAAEQALAEFIKPRKIDVKELAGRV